MPSPRFLPRLGVGLAVGLTLVGIVSGRGAHVATAAQRPNVVIIVSDDQRWDKVTPTYTPRIWNRLIDTPADSVHPAATSVAFTNAFVPNPLCCPSRTSILTGLYSHSTGVWGNSGPYGGFEAFDDKHTIAVDFNDAGYRTALIGKYLNGYVTRKTTYVPPGWDRWFATNTGAYYDYGARSARRYETSATPGWNGRLLHFDSRPERDYSTNVLREQAIGFVQDAQAVGEPFFLYFSLTAPHDPAIPDPDDINRFAGQPDVAFRGSPASSMLDSAYGVDRAVGKLLDVLEPNTIVVYLSDNGFLWGEHSLVGKGVPYNEAIRIPMVVASLDGSYDPIAAARDLVLNVDLRPTLTRAAGVPMLTRSEGLAWGSPRYVPRSSFVLEHGEVTQFCGVRELDWMYARYATGDELLFHDSGDPLEQTNLLPLVDTDATVGTEYARLRSLSMNLCDPVPPGFTW